MAAPAAVAAAPRTAAFRTRLLGLGFGLAALAAPLAAQSLLYVENGDKLTLVRRAVDNTPWILEDGKWAADTDGVFVFKPADDYLPMFISVKNAYFKRRSGGGPGGKVELVPNEPGGTITGKVGSGGKLNNRFEFSFDLQAPTALDDVFIVLEMRTQKEGNVLFLQEIGHLEAHRYRHFDLFRPLASALGDMRRTLHVFVGGKEVLTSAISAAKQARALDRMVANRIALVHDADLQPFLGPLPEYPEALLATRPKGQAVLSFRVGVHGEVIAPAVVSATDPAFGTAAIAAIQQWRFLPRVKDNSPVEMPAEMPFVFDPPS
jgi:TonB family protein